MRVTTTGTRLFMLDSSEPVGWWTYAACAGHDPEWWSDDLSGRARATQICVTCPVRARCLDEAIRQGDVGVVRGGMLLTHGRRGRTSTPLFCQRCGVNPLPVSVDPPRQRECLRCRREQRALAGRRPHPGADDLCVERSA